MNRDVLDDLLTEQRARQARQKSGGSTFDTIPLRLLGEFEVAAILGLSVKTLRRWRLLGRGPQFTRVGGTAIRYEMEKLQQWVSSQPQGGEVPAA